VVGQRGEPGGCRYLPEPLERDARTEELLVGRQLVGDDAEAGGVIGQLLGFEGVAADRDDGGRSTTKAAPGETVGAAAGFGLQRGADDRPGSLEPVGAGGG
jgi:hypothetical protein